MSQKPKPGTKAADAAALRAERLAQQLRANLKRRKASAKPQGGGGEPPHGEPEERGSSS